MGLDNSTIADGLSTLLKPVVIALVDDSSAVKVDAVINSNKTILTSISVKKDDVGKVIGKEGRTAGAIRTIASAFCARHDCRSIVEIVD